MRGTARRLALGFALAAAVAPAAGGAPATRAPLDAAAVDVAIGAALPRGLAFVDAEGRATSLDGVVAAASGRPLLLILADYDCRMLCSRVLDGASQAIRAAGLRPGRDLQVVTIGLDPRDVRARARAQQQHVLAAFDPALPPGDWPFLLGREDAVARLADRLGFTYRFDPKTDQFAHPAVVFLLTPDGRVSDALYGVVFDPAALARGVTRAARGVVGPTISPILLRCFQYVPALRQHAGAIRLFLRAGASLSLLALVAGGWLLVRRRRRREADS
ncbi:MAG: SCO family protein [Myxococcota bacterium]